MKKKILFAALFAGISVAGFTAKAQTALVTVEPAPSDEAYAYNTYYDIQLGFSGEITFDSAVLSYNDTEIELPSSLTGVIRNNDYIQLVVSNPNYKNYIQEAADAGASSFVLTVKGVESDGAPVSENKFDNEYVTVDNGTVTLTYKIEAPAKYLPEASTWPEVFYEYWEPGNTDAIAVLVFDQPVVSVYEASVVMAEVVQGSQANGDELLSYELNPSDFVIEGNTISIDFAGVKRPGNNAMVTVVIKTVTGENGLSAEFGNGVTLFKSIPYMAGEAPEAGIAELLNDKSGKEGIYRIDGVKLTKDNLPGGLYIVNGKKVLVK